MIGQDPKAGTKREAKTKVNLTVSKGQQEVEITVPDLTNKTAEQAKKELTANGLKYAEGEPGNSDSIAKDHIYKQDPAAGTKVDKDTVVTVYLSLGDGGIEVPNVVGKSLGEAVTIINNAGFYVDENYDYRYDDSVPENQVISQSPNAGEKLKQDGTVHLVVSKGKEKSTFSVAVNSNGGGTVSASASSVEEGGQVTIYITPNDGYEVASVRGLDDVPSNGGTFTLTNIASNINVTVTFQQKATPNPPPTPDPEQNGQS